MQQPNGGAPLARSPHESGRAVERDDGGRGPRGAAAAAAARAALQVLLRRARQRALRGDHASCPSTTRRARRRRSSSAHAGAIVAAVAPGELVELGLGRRPQDPPASSTPCARAARSRACLLLEINEGYLRESVDGSQADYPEASVRGIVGDFQHDLAALGPGRRPAAALPRGHDRQPAPRRRCPRSSAARPRVLAPGDGFLVGRRPRQGPGPPPRRLQRRGRRHGRVQPATSSASSTTACAPTSIPRPSSTSPSTIPSRQWIEMRLRARRPHGGARARAPASSSTLRSGRRDPHRALLQVHARVASRARLAGTGLALERWITDAEGLFASALLRRCLTLERLQAAWRRSDRLLGAPHRRGLARSSRSPLRQPFVFYLGHLPAFAWNQIGRGLLGRAASPRARHPVRARHRSHGRRLATSRRRCGPSARRILAYRDRIRTELHPGPRGSEVRRRRRAGRGDGGRARADAPRDAALHAAGARPRAEAAAARLARAGRSRRGAARRARSRCPRASSSSARPRLPAVRLGQRVPGAPRSTVPAFAIDALPVTNAEFARVRRGRRLHRRPRCGATTDWGWRTRLRLRQPHSWRGRRRGLPCARPARGRPLRARRPLAGHGQLGRGARLRALARRAAADRGRVAPRRPRHAGRRRAGTGRGATSRRPTTTATSTSGTPRPCPWARSRPGASAWGVHELVGNGWEWTCTPFAPFPGFAPMPRYPGYSADFFDGSHFVLLGGSWATDADARAAQLPQLVPAPLPVRLLEVPLRAVALTCLLIAPAVRVPRAKHLDRAVEERARRGRLGRAIACGHDFAAGQHRPRPALAVPVASRRRASGSGSGRRGQGVT